MEVQPRATQNRVHADYKMSFHVWREGRNGEVNGKKRRLMLYIKL